MQGKHVFTYSIGNFPTFRCAEQLRNDVDYHNLCVTTVSVGGGLSYGALGYSHHTIQDYGFMRLLPNTLIMSPCDPNEVTACLNYITSNPQPSYLRLGKTGEDNFTNPSAILPGELNKIAENNSNELLITTGTAIQNISKTFLEKFTVYSFPMWGEGISSSNLERIIKKFTSVVILEDHLKSGGFFSWVLENLNDRSLCSRVSSYSISSKIIGEVGSHGYLQSKFLKWG